MWRFGLASGRESDKLAGWSKADLAIEIVGIFRTNDPAEDYWFADGSLDPGRWQSYLRMGRATAHEQRRRPGEAAQAQPAWRRLSVGR